MLPANFFFIVSFRLSNLIRSCIKCLFVIYVVFILSGMPINPPHSLLIRYFIKDSFDKCFFLDCFPCFFKGTN